MMKETGEINISLTRDSDQGVVVQLTQEMSEVFIFQSYKKSKNEDSDKLVNWVIKNIPQEFDDYRISLKHCGYDLYPVYTKLNALGAHVSLV